MSYPIAPKPRRRPDDFNIGKQLGDGSLSTVVVGIERATGKRYALKVFDRRLLRSNKKDADVTMEEHCLRRLNHPSIVKLHSSFRDGDAAYLALELLTGGELWAMVKDVGCPDRLARHYLGQVVEAVSYLRDAQIVHRDLKAENAIISAQGNVKLVDFGTAKDLANPHIKGAGTVSFKKVLEDNVGTPNFMAPEVIRNKFSDFRSDVWSLGCMIYQVVTGLPPFGSVDLERVYRRAMAARLKIPTGLSEAARDLIRRMVVLDPMARLFAPLRAEGPHFEGAHCQPAPVPSLEELCLRALGSRWERLGALAAPWAAARGGKLLDEVHAVLDRFAEVAVLNADKPCLRSPSASPERDGS